MMFKTISLDPSVSTNLCSTTRSIRPLNLGIDLPIFHFPWINVIVPYNITISSPLFKVYDLQISLITYHKSFLTH